MEGTDLNSYVNKYTDHFKYTHLKKLYKQYIVIF